jgi:hypothetical protein
MGIASPFFTTKSHEKEVRSTDTYLPVYSSQDISDAWVVVYSSCFMQFLMFIQTAEISITWELRWVFCNPDGLSHGQSQTKHNTPILHDFGRKKTYHTFPASKIFAGYIIIIRSAKFTLKKQNLISLWCCVTGVVKVSGLHMHVRSYFFQLLTCWYDQWWYIWWDSSCVVKHTPPCTVGMQWKRRPWCLKTHHSVM